MYLYYLASIGTSTKVLYQKIKKLPHLAVILDHGEAFINTQNDSIIDPFVSVTISSNTIKNILEDNPIMKQSIDLIMEFDIVEALTSLEIKYNIDIPDPIKLQYQEYDSERKLFIEDKIYQRTLY